MKKENSDQTNKQERARNPQYKQDQVLLFTVNKANWSIRRVFEYMTIIIQMDVYQLRSPKSLPPFNLKWLQQ